MNERSSPPRLQTLEEIEKTGLSGLLEVLREEGIDAVRRVLWDATGSWYKGYATPAESNLASTEQKRLDWEMAVRIEKIICTVLHKAHERQVEETMEALAQGS